MANVNVIIDSITNEVQLEETPFEGSKHLIYGSGANPVLTPGQSFIAYETIPSGDSLGFVECSDSAVIFSIISGNTNNDFTINGTTGELTTAKILDYETLNLYSLGIRVESSLLPELTDTTSVTVNVLKVYTACADYTPSYSGTPIEDLIGYLQVDPIVLGSGTLGDYAIEWRVGSTTGNLALTTGNSGNTDPSIQAYHPFYEPVQAGELYPVFKYITIDGTGFTAYARTEYEYSPDLLTCLSPLTVLYLTCSNGATGSTWFHTLEYTNTEMNASVANRSISYEINEEITLIAWEFYGYAVADRMTMYYVSGEDQTLVSDWVVGSDCTGYTYTSYPYLYASTYLRTAYFLTGFTYTEGDYLLFNITPGYNNPAETDTNWQLQLACVGDPNVNGGWNGVVLDSNDYSTILTGDTYLEFNSGQCRYDLHIKTLSGVTFYNDVSDSDPYKYLRTTLYQSTDWDTEYITTFTYDTGISSSWVNNLAYGSWVPLDGTMTIEADGTGHTITYSFTDEGDYLFYKSEWATLTGSTEWTSAWSSNDEQFEHYWSMQSYYKISLTSGDTYSTIYMYANIHEQTMDFNDDSYIITVTLPPQFMGYSGTTGAPEGCDGAYADIDSQYVTTPNYWYSGYTETWETIWRNTHPWATRRVSAITSTFNLGRTVTLGISTLVGPVQHDPNLLPSPRWTTSWQSSQYFLFKMYLYALITDAEDPVNNWELYNYLDENGAYITPAVLIKKVGP